MCLSWLQLRYKFSGENGLSFSLLLLLSRFSRVSDSVRPHRWQPTRLHRPWDSQGKNTGVGCHFSLPVEYKPCHLCGGRCGNIYPKTFHNRNWLTMIKIHFLLGMQIQKSTTTCQQSDTTIDYHKSTMTKQFIFTYVRRIHR